MAGPYKYVDPDGAAELVAKVDEKLGDKLSLSAKKKQTIGYDLQVNGNVYTHGVTLGTDDGYTGIPIINAAGGEIYAKYLEASSLLVTDPLRYDDDNDPSEFRVALLRVGNLGECYAADSSQVVAMLGIPSIPSATTADAGKFLRVDSSGSPAWSTVPSAKGVGF